MNEWNYRKLNVTGLPELRSVFPVSLLFAYVPVDFLKDVGICWQRTAQVLSSMKLSHGTVGVLCM